MTPRHRTNPTKPLRRLNGPHLKSVLIFRREPKWIAELFKCRSCTRALNIAETSSGDLIKAHQHDRHEDRALIRLKPHRYKGCELLAFVTTTPVLVHSRAAERCRCRLLATHLTTEAVAAHPRVVYSRQI